MTAKPLIANHGTNQVEELGSGVSLYGGTPIGGIVIWSGAVGSPPDGFILCDGTAISRTDFATLFTIVGTTFGTGNGSSTFNIPNLRDRFIVGAGDGYNLNATGGSSTTTLGTTNLPSHTHQLGGNTGSQNLTHNHSYVGHTYPGSGPEQNQSGGPEDRTSFNVAKTTDNNSGNLDHSHTLPANTGNQGGTMGQSFDNKPPYIALAYIIRTV